MALVCPVGHPPGTGTSFCRLCGRDYLEVSEVVETLVPVQEPPVEARAVIPAMPVAPERRSAPVAPPVAAPPSPPVAPPHAVSSAPSPAAPRLGSQSGDVDSSRPPGAGAVPPPPAPPAPPVVPRPEPPKAPEVVAVPAPVAIQVTMPLVPADKTTDKPSPTSTTPVDLGGPTIEARSDDGDDEPKPSNVRRELDRAALLAGVVGGFFGGAVSGAAVTYFLS